ncbi:hypothetical protein GF323_03560 [Candidatus Woesearchaeota archaeon]|nr:hypothetical protein [Candidatus Woesearchaeota archaeon]
MEFYDPKEAAKRTAEIIRAGRNTSRNLMHYFGLYSKELSAVVADPYFRGEFVDALGEFYRKKGVARLSIPQLFRLAENPQNFIENMGFTCSQAAAYAAEHSNPDENGAHERILKQFYYLKSVLTGKAIKGDTYLSRAFVEGITEFWNLTNVRSLNVSQMHEVIEKPGELAEKANSVYSVKEAESKLGVTRCNLMHWMETGCVEFEIFGRRRQPLKSRIDSMRGYIERKTEEGQCAGSNKERLSIYNEYLINHGPRFSLARFFELEKKAKRYERIKTKIASLEERLSAKDEKHSGPSTARYRELNNRLRAYYNTVWEALESSLMQLTALREQAAYLEAISPEKNDDRYAALEQGKNDLEKKLKKTEKKLLKAQNEKSELEKRLGGEEEPDGSEMLLEKLGEAKKRNNKLKIALASGKRQREGLKNKLDKLGREYEGLKKKYNKLVSEQSESTGQQPAGPIEYHAYDPKETHTYEKGDIVLNRKYGFGGVAEVTQRAITVRFKAGLKNLVHNPDEIIS